MLMLLIIKRCCGIDINPAAVSLSQRSCSFEIPPGLTTAEHRPIIVQADSRKLTGALFTNESYDHILSHPPYKDCVAYSLHIEGDLSR
jgi:tRNA1(Val) A37 N6-methylase TrmN6